MLLIFDDNDACNVELFGYGKYFIGWFQSKVCSWYLNKCLKIQSSFDASNLIMIYKY